MKGYWTEFTIGIIMIASPWVLGFSDISLAKWCNVLVGLVLVLISARVLFGERPQAMPAVPSGEESPKGRAKNRVE